MSMQGKPGSFVTGSCRKIPKQLEQTCKTQERRSLVAVGLRSSKWPNGGVRHLKRARNGGKEKFKKKNKKNKKTKHLR